MRYYRLDGTITHEQLAMMVGATRETVTKALTLLRLRGIVEMKKNHYIINKPMALPPFSVKK
jgi:CRP-like cAMP-binding protein